MSRFLEVTVLTNITGGGADESTLCINVDRIDSIKEDGPYRVIIAVNGHFYIIDDSYQSFIDKLRKLLK